MFALSLGVLFLGARQTAVTAQGSADSIYFPVVAHAQSAPDCNVPDTSYGTLAPLVPTDRPAEEHADLNLALRGWSPTSATLALILYGGPTDPAAPQLDSLFHPYRLPRFNSAHRVHHWSWDCNCRGGPITDWDVTLLGMATTAGETLHVPASGYEIGGGYEVLVLYATQNRLTLKYTAEDNVAQGYTLHLESVCVEPDLLALYQQMNAGGRDRLPALREGQAFGRAPGGSIRLAVRDNGAFLDPRSQKDWWKQYPAP